MGHQKSRNLFTGVFHRTFRYFFTEFMNLGKYKTIISQQKFESGHLADLLICFKPINQILGQSKSDIYFHLEKFLFCKNIGHISLYAICSAFGGI